MNAFALSSTYDRDSLMLLLPTLLITIFLYRSIEHASTVKRSLLYITVVDKYPYLLQIHISKS